MNFLQDTCGRPVIRTSGQPVSPTFVNGPQVADFRGGEIRSTGNQVLQTVGEGALYGTRGPVVAADIEASGVWINGLQADGSGAFAISSVRANLKLVRTRGDSVIVGVTVRDNAASLIDLRGASITAVLSAADQDPIYGMIDFTGAADGRAVAIFAKGQTMAGVYTMQVSITMGPRRQTVLTYPLRVSRSLF